MTDYRIQRLLFFLCFNFTSYFLPFNFSWSRFFLFLFRCFSHKFGKKGSAWSAFIKICLSSNLAKAIAENCQLCLSMVSTNPWKTNAFFVGKSNHRANRSRAKIIKFNPWSNLEYFLKKDFRISADLKSKKKCQSTSVSSVIETRYFVHTHGSSRKIISARTLRCWLRMAFISRVKLGH